MFCLLVFFFSYSLIYIHSHLNYFLPSVCLGLICSSLSSFFEEKVLTDLTFIFLLLWGFIAINYLCTVLFLHLLSFDMLWFHFNSSQTILKHAHTKTWMQISLTALLIIGKNLEAHTNWYICTMEYYSESFFNDFKKSSHKEDMNKY